MVKSKRISSGGSTRRSHHGHQQNKNTSGLRHHRRSSLQASESTSLKPTSALLGSQKIVFDNGSIDTHEGGQLDMTPQEAHYTDRSPPGGRPGGFTAINSERHFVDHVQTPAVDFASAKRQKPTDKSASQHQPMSTNRVVTNLAFAAQNDTPTGKGTRKSETSTSPAKAPMPNLLRSPTKVEVPIDPRLSKQYIHKVQNEQRRRVGNNMAKYHTFSSHVNDGASVEDKDGSTAENKARSKKKAAIEEQETKSNTQIRQDSESSSSTSDIESQSSAATSSDMASGSDSDSHRSVDSNSSSTTSDQSSSASSSSSVSKFIDGAFGQSGAFPDKQIKTKHDVDREERRARKKKERKEIKNNKEKHRKSAFNEQAESQMKSGRELLQAEAEKTISDVGKRLELKRRYREKSQATKSSGTREQTSNKNSRTTAAAKALEKDLVCKLNELIPPYILNSAKQHLQTTTAAKEEEQESKKRKRAKLEECQDESQKPQISKNAIVLKAAYNTIVRLSARNVAAAGGGRDLIHQHRSQGGSEAGLEKAIYNTNSGNGGHSSATQQTTAYLEHDLARIAREREKKIELLELELRNYRQQQSMR